jgi:hypothetical protein
MMKNRGSAAARGGLAAGGRERGVASMADVNLAEMRQHYRAAKLDSEDHAQRLLSLGFGAAAAVLLMTAPALSPVLHLVWLGLVAGLAVGGLVARRFVYDRLREALVDQALQLHTPVDRELWDRLGTMRPVPAPINQYVEHVLNTYLDMKGRVDEGAEVELGQVQLIEARERVMDYLDLAERTGQIRNILEQHARRLAEDDQVKLRQRFSEQCAGLQAIAQSFDRTLGNLLVAQVLRDELGETTIEEVAERMREIEEEFDEVKQSLHV